VGDKTKEELSKEIVTVEMVKALDKRQWSATRKGALIGAGVGGVLGGLNAAVTGDPAHLGGAFGVAATGAIIGAIVEHGRSAYIKDVVAAIEGKQS
jgi:uncharacterized membrane protein